MSKESISLLKHNVPQEAISALSEMVKENAQLKARIAKLKAKEAEFDLLYVALFNLVNLKSHKDAFGKTEYYQKAQPEVWQQARDALTGKHGKQYLAEVQANAIEEILPPKIDPETSGKSARYCLGYNDCNRDIRIHVKSLRDKASEPNNSVKENE